jgi:hypothetical protein
MRGSRWQSRAGVSPAQRALQREPNCHLNFRLTSFGGGRRDARPTLSRITLHACRAEAQRRRISRN